MALRNRKFLLTLHITASLGWFGAVASFLVLAVIGVLTKNGLQEQAAYVAMQWITWLVIVPLAFASLLSGIACAQGTRWGLFRYAWISIKFALTSAAIAVLMIHTQLIDRLSAEAQRTPMLGAALHGLGRHMLLAAIAALIVLSVLTALSVYKPRSKNRHTALR